MSTVEFDPFAARRFSAERRANAEQARALAAARVTGALRERLRVPTLTE